VGPYLSERQWGGVRENTNRNIEAWNDLTHDQARSRAYQSGEDGIAGFCDDNMLLCFSVAMWNGKDPILKSGCSASPTARAITARRQGVLLLPRQHADTLVRKDAVQVPAGAYPYYDWSPRTDGARAMISSSSCSIPESSTRIDTSTSSSSSPRPIRRHPDPHQRGQSWS